jgi:hypothetical protein
MLVHHPVHAKRPDCRTAQRREQNAANRITQRLTKTTLERRDYKLRLPTVLGALHNFNPLR